MVTAIDRGAPTATGVRVRALAPLLAWLSRVTSGIRYAWPALAAYLVLRAVGVLMLYIWVRADDSHFPLRLARSDGVHYLNIATQGYDSGVVEGRLSNLAFFPLYPKLIGWLDPILPLSTTATAIAIAWAASLAAAWGIFAVGAHVGGRRVGIMLAALWGVVPHAIVEQMPYTEGIFTAFAAWTLWAVLTNRWLTAGALCVLAGLTRPTATALIPVVVLAALVAIFKRRDTWRPYVAITLAPVGWVGYLLWVADRTGRPDGWFHIQNDQWKMSFDGGVSTVRFAADFLSRESPFEFMLVGLTLVLAVALFILSFIDRQPWQLLLYSGLMLVTAWGAAGYFNARARFLLPAFALLLPIATALAKSRGGRAWVVLGTLAVISAYVGCYLVLIWVNSP